MKKYLAFNIFYFFVKRLIFLLKVYFFCHISEYIVICIVYMNSKLNKTIENKIHRVKVTSDPDPDPESDPDPDPEPDPDP